MSNHPGPFILESMSKSSKLKYKDISVYNILSSQIFTKYMKKSSKCTCNLFMQASFTHTISHQFMKKYRFGIQNSLSHHDV